MASSEINLATLSEPRTLEDALVLLKVLVAEVVQLRGENQKLREEVASLKKDSTTSSKPPSSDITQPPEKRRQKGKRKRGAQKGHAAKFRALFPPEEVDQVHDLQLKGNCCPECGEKFDRDANRNTLVHQSVELVEKPRRVDEYRLHGVWCEHCEEYHYPELPEGVIENSLCGPRLQSLLAYLKGNLGASYTEIQQFCADVLEVQLSTGMVAKMVRRVSEALAAPYEEVQEAVQGEARLNIDETGWKENGARLWMWVFCSATIGFFAIRTSRGAKVLKEILGDTFGGAITSDFYSAYVCYKTIQQQFCLAHLIRDIKFLTTLPQADVKEFGEKVLEYFRALFELWHHRAEYPPGEFEKKADKLQRKLFTYLTTVTLPKGKAATLKKCLVKHWASLFRFVKHPDKYDPTNNHAERVLRRAVRLRRSSQGSRSQVGRQWNERILTTLATCRLQNRNAWTFILDTVRSHNFGGPVPSLLPGK